MKVLRFSLACILSLISGETFLAGLFGYAAIYTTGPWLERLMFGSITLAFVFAKSFQIGRASRRHFG